mgnify:CR=1 FL=1
MQTRPVLLNHWEGLYFDFDANSLTDMASSGADLGVRLFVMDDGWFGNGDKARIDDTRGLGDWVVNSHRFPNGLAHFVDRINQFPDGKLQLGIWVEPEMVNLASDLYTAHPNWVLQSPGHIRSLHRSQLVPDLGQIEAQNYIISWMTNLLDSANIQYLKWDNDRTMHENGLSVGGSSVYPRALQGAGHPHE